MKRTRKSLAILLAICMVAAMLPTAAFAAQAPPTLTVENAGSNWSGIYEWSITAAYGEAITEVFSNGVKLTNSDNFWADYDVFDGMWAYQSDMGSLYIDIPDNTNFTIIVKANGYDDLEIIGGDGYDPNAPNNKPTAKVPVPTQEVAPGGTATFIASDIAEDADKDELTITAITAEPDGTYATADLEAGKVTLTGVAKGDTNIEVTVSDGEDTVDVTVPVKVKLLTAPVLTVKDYIQGTNVVLGINNNDTDWWTILKNLDKVNQKESLYIKESGTEEYKNNQSNDFTVSYSAYSPKTITLNNTNTSSFFTDNGFNNIGNFDIKIVVAGYEDTEVSITILKKGPTITKDTTNNTMTENKLNNDIELTFVEDPEYRSAISAVSIKDLDGNTNKYEKSKDKFDTQTPGTLILDKTLFPKGGGNYSITVHANGYGDSSAITQTIIGNPPELNPDRINYLLNEAGQFEGELTITFTDGPWGSSWGTVKINDTILSSSDYSKSTAGQVTFKGDKVQGALKAGENTITIESSSYSPTYTAAEVKQVIVSSEAPPNITADTTDNFVNEEIDLTFEANQTWQNAIQDITVDGVSATEKYQVSDGMIKLDSSLFPEERDYEIAVIANVYPGDQNRNYRTAVVTQEIISPDRAHAPCLSITGKAPYYALNDLVFDLATEDEGFGDKIHKVTLNGKTLTPDTDYSFNKEAKQLTVSGSLLTEGKDYTVQVKALGYENVSSTVAVTLNPVPIFETLDAKIQSTDLTFYFKGYDSWFEAMPSPVTSLTTIDGKPAAGTVQQGTMTANPSNPDLVGAHYVRFTRYAVSSFYDVPGEHIALIKVPGYETAKLVINYCNESPALTSDPDSVTPEELAYTFDQDADWLATAPKVYLNGSKEPLSEDLYTLAEGKFTLKSSALQPGVNKIILRAEQYLDVALEHFVEKEEAALTVKEGEEILKEFTLKELKDLAVNRTYSFSAYNNNPTVKEEKGLQGPTVEAIINKAYEEAHKETTVSALSGDTVITTLDNKDFKVEFTAKSLFQTTRYYFPNLDDADSAQWYQGGSELAKSGKTEVPAIINLTAGESFGRIFVGQATAIDQVYPYYNKGVGDGGQIIIQETKATAAPTVTAAEPASGSTVAKGREITFTVPSTTTKGAKLYYTIGTDGQEPEDPNLDNSYMYNIDRDNAIFQKPVLDVLGTNIIKTRYFVPGQMDSEVATFTYTVKEAPPALTPAKNAKVNNDAVITFTDDAKWREKVTAVTVNEAPVAADQYSLDAGKLTLNKALFTKSGDYIIVVTADGYANAEVKQSVSSGGSGGGGGGGGTATSDKPSVKVEGAGGKTSLSSDGKTLTITPDEGYKVEDVLLNGVSQGSVTTLKDLKASDQVVVRFAKTGEEEPGEEAGGFADMKNHWAKDAVDYVTEKGYFNGTSETAFSPDGSMTRAMFVTVLGRMSKADTSKYTKSSFADVSMESYYGGYVEWASENGIVDGVGEGAFAPDRAVTREQMAKMLLAYFNYLKKGPEGSWAIQLKYTDLAQISQWAMEGVMFCTMKELITGYADGTFRPQNTATRAEVATILSRVDEAQ